MEYRIKQELKGLTPYKPGKPIDEVKRELGLEKVTKLASNENPFGCSEYAKQAITQSLDELAIYPDGYSADLRNKVAKSLNINESQLIFGNGSDEVIQILCRAVLQKGTNMVSANPTFPQYRHNAVIEGAEIREIDNIDGAHNLEGMLQAIDSETRIVWVCTPNNPTGNYINEQTLYKFITRVPKEVLVVVDEAYFEYVVADDYPDTTKWLNEFDNLLILRTFSKAYGLAGLRIGYGMANEQLIQAIEPAREPFNTSSIAQAAAIAAIDDTGFIEKCRIANRSGMAQFESFCHSAGLTYYPSQANFILIDFEVSGDIVFDYLLRNGFIVRSGEALGYPTSVRITVGSKEQNEEIINILTAFLKEQR
ncbi:histidinol-phosphate transaminase [Bacillus solimangrovi]|uniref:Histidinol-phosphate aminotransferase n=1 Tax=Bacillus solimangrovi TaxID=1305675 RepID=A0A1E5LH89_9BACI|nr:histidinol-phosphate transaminase [Bacillus solimangrovi]OEH93443.1 histidinol-phosphate transaminase [Bacillus solimangrovi]